jgi:hypothetical protein
MDIREQPMLKGSYEIERFLFGSQQLNSGGWVQGQTVVGKVVVDGTPLECLTRPIYAYLEYCGRINSVGDEAFTHLQSCGRGLSAQFLSSLGVPFKVAPAIERVNGLSDISGGFPPAVLWGASGKGSRNLYLKGPGNFSVYQMHMAYVHCPLSDSIGLINRAPRLAKSFSKANEQLVLVSSIAFANVFAIQSEFAVSPMEWVSIATQVLDGARQNKWQFDLLASELSGHHY